MSDESSSYSSYYHAIAMSRERIAALRRERARLEELLSEVRRGQAQFQEQVERKRTLARRAQQHPRSGVARGFGNAFQARTGAAFQEGARTDFVSAQREVERAIDRLNSEIAREQAAIDVSERAVASLRAREGAVACR